MVANDQASESVWCARDGALNAEIAQNALAIECSTLSHAWVAKLSAQCMARGLRYIDAPVTGLPDAASAGQLTLLVGADEQDLEAALPMLSELSSKVIRFGTIGTGTAYKLIINLLGAIQIASAAEAVAMAERAGLNLSTVAEAISTSQAASPQVVRNVHRMVAMDHVRNVVFSSALRQKDVEYALRFAQDIHASAPFGLVADRIYRDLCARGFADINESSVIDVLRNPSGRRTE
jgi:3-hydroxyisobutyrate dehydrogenase